MKEEVTELSRRLVVGHGRDGRCRYDKEAKRELVEASMQPGVSISRMALQHGVNANLLRKWIDDYRRRREVEADLQATEAKAETAQSAFMPVVAVKVPAKTSPVRVEARLPNGVKLDLSGLGQDDLSSILQTLSTLPCSGLTQG